MAPGETDLTNVDAPTPRNTTLPIKKGSHRRVLSLPNSSSKKMKKCLDSKNENREGVCASAPPDMAAKANEEKKKTKDYHRGSDNEEEEEVKVKHEEEDVHFGRPPIQSDGKPNNNELSNTKKGSIVKVKDGRYKGEVIVTGIRGIVFLTGKHKYKYGVVIGWLNNNRTCRVRINPSITVDKEKVLKQQWNAKLDRIIASLDNVNVGNDDDKAQKSCRNTLSTTQRTDTTIDSRTANIIAIDDSSHKQAKVAAATVTPSSPAVSSSSRSNGSDNDVKKSAIGRNKKTSEYSSPFIPRRTFSAGDYDGDGDDDDDQHTATDTAAAEEKKETGTTLATAVVATAVAATAAVATATATTTAATTTNTIAVTATAADDDENIVKHQEGEKEEKAFASGADGNEDEDAPKQMVSKNNVKDVAAEEKTKSNGETKIDTGYEKEEAAELVRTSYDTGNEDAAVTIAVQRIKSGKESTKNAVIAAANVPLTIAVTATTTTTKDAETNDGGEEQKEKPVPKKKPSSLLNNNDNGKNDNDSLRSSDDDNVDFFASISTDPSNDDEDENKDGSKDEKDGQDDESNTTATTTTVPFEKTSGSEDAAAATAHNIGQKSIDERIALMIADVQGMTTTILSIIKRPTIGNSNKKEKKPILQSLCENYKFDNPSYLTPQKRSIITNLIERLKKEAAKNTAALANRSPRKGITTSKGLTKKSITKNALNVKKRKIDNEGVTAAKTKKIKRNHTKGVTIDKSQNAITENTSEGFKLTLEQEMEAVSASAKLSVTSRDVNTNTGRRLRTCRKASPSSSSSKQDKKKKKDVTTEMNVKGTDETAEENSDDESFSNSPNDGEYEDDDGTQDNDEEEPPAKKINTKIPPQVYIDAVKKFVSYPCKPSKAEFLRSEESGPILNDEDRMQVNFGRYLKKHGPKFASLPRPPTPQMSPMSSLSFSAAKASAYTMLLDREAKLRKEYDEYAMKKIAATGQEQIDHYKNLVELTESSMLKLAEEINKFYN